MRNKLPSGVIKIRGVNLWAHVGVLESERLLGQDFLLDISLWIDVSNAATYDDVKLSADYSVAIKGLQKLSFTIKCLTIEMFGDKILDYLEGLYGPIPIKIILKKCRPPIKGFQGSVEIEMSRNYEI